MKRAFTGVFALTAGLSMALAAVAPARADAWPINDTFSIAGTDGGANWYFDGYGLSGGDDQNGLTSAYLYYPLEIVGPQYLYCDGPNGSVTTADNGDIVIDCPVETDAFGTTGVSYQMHFRLYPQSEFGYLARQWVEVHNNSGSVFDTSAQPFNVTFYYNYYAWDRGDPWQTNIAADLDQDGDVWGAGGDLDPTAIATSAAWAAPCASNRITYDVPHDKYMFPAEANVIPDGGSVNFVTFINMVFPDSTNADPADAAFQTALSQAQTEFDAGLTGRLAAGLPGGLVISGWTDGECPPLPSTPQPSAPELPNTGVDAGSLGATGIAAVGLLMAGCAALVARRRTVGR